MSTPFTAALFACERQSQLDRGKAALPWEGTTLWEKQIRLLEKLKPAQLLILGQSGGPYAGSAYHLVHEHDSRQGPLAGLNELISVCTSPRILVLDLNMAWMTLPVLEEMLSFEDGVVPEFQGVQEGITAVYPTDILPLVRNTMQSPVRSIDAFIRLALNNGFIDTWSIPAGCEKCFKRWDGSSPA